MFLMTSCFFSDEVSVKMSFVNPPKEVYTNLDNLDDVYDEITIKVNKETFTLAELVDKGAKVIGFNFDTPTDSRTMAIYYMRDTLVSEYKVQFVVSGVELNKEVIYLSLEEEFDLIAKVTPDEVVNKNITWSSDNTDVATVIDGKVKAIDYGTANITVTTEEGNYTDTCIVNVFKDPEEVELDKHTVNMCISDTDTLTVTLKPVGECNTNVIWSSSDSSIVSVNNGLITALKTGTAKITVTTKNNHLTDTCNVTVVKRDSELTIPSAKNNLVYNGENQELIIEGTCVGGTLKYAISDVEPTDSEYSTDVPKAIIAGTYKVWYKVFGNNVYNGIEASSISVSISKATYDMSNVEWDYTNSFTYDGTEKVVELKNIPSGVSCSYINNKYIEHGTYTASVSFSYDATNYNPISFNTLSWTIDKGYYDMSKVKWNYSNSFIYDGTEKVVELNNLPSGVTASYTNNKNTYVGNYTASVTFSYETANYNEPSFDDLDWEISKATPEVTAPTAITGLVYTGSAQSLISAGSTTGGTLQYKVDSGSYSTDIPKGTNAGTHTVYYKVVEDSNYNSVAEANISVTIAKADATIDTTNVVKSYTYSGSEQTVNSGAKLNHSETTLVYSNNTFTNVPSTGKQTITISSVETTNYKQASTTVEITINKATPEVTAPTAVSGLVYSGSAQSLISAGSTNAGTIQYKVGDGSYSESIPQASATGTHTVYYKVIGNSNYSDVEEASISVTISKIKVSLPIAESGLVYNGSEQTGVVLPNDAKYTLSNNKGTNASTSYSATASLTDKTIYEWDTKNSSDDQSISWSIAPKDVTDDMISSIPYQIYTGSNVKPTLTVTDGTVLVLDTDYTVSYKNNINVGTATATITGTGNYKGTASKDFTIGNPLKLTANTASSTVTPKFVSGTFETSTDGTTWTTGVSGTQFTLTNIGDSLYIKGIDCTTYGLVYVPIIPSFPMYGYTWKNAEDPFVMSGSISASGDITSLTNGLGGNATLSDNCYYGIFKNCTALTTAPNLPATTLATSCYQEMFSGCTALEAAPELPATTLANTCYKYMFYGCSKLAKAPALSATTLANNCYEGMFFNCTSIEVAPTLSVMKLVEGCYKEMFYGCSKLAKAPALPATTLATSCYEGMFSYCTSFTTLPELPATKLASKCYKYMFYFCSGITIVPENYLPVMELEEACYAGMFQYCTELTQAPKLPAIVLTPSCYSGMFSNCKKLTTSPVLSSTTLAKSCYSLMFAWSGLTVAPELPATTLAVSCYALMFTGCYLTSTPELKAEVLPDECYTQMFESNKIKITTTKPKTGVEGTDWGVIFGGNKTVGNNSAYLMFNAMATHDLWTPPVDGTTYYWYKEN